MRIAIDATPAAVQRGGVGRYTRELLRALVQSSSGHHFVLSTAADPTQIDSLLSTLPPGAWREARRLPASERLMTALWQRARLPIRIDRWIGDHDVFHGVDFALPPTQAATVATVHDLSFLVCPEYCHPDLARYLQATVPRTIERADAVITVSASVAAEVACAFPAAREKIVAIPNGVEIPERPAENEPAGRPTILMVGTVEPRKNHQTLLQAMPEIRDAVAEAQLVVVGRRGWLADEIVRDLRQGQAEGWLTWLENADDDELECAYSQASVLVAASHYEGFGLPLLEAMVRGIPCVASDIAAHREVAAGCATLVEPHDVGALSAAVVDLLDDGAQREQLAAAGRNRAGTYSWNETARRTLRIYERIASGGVS